MAKITFRARKEFFWDGVELKKGDLVEIDEGHPRLRAILEQSHHVEYANVDAPKPSTMVTQIG